MKKVFCILLVFSLLVSCTAAVAEGDDTGKVPAGIELSKLPATSSEKRVALKEESAYAISEPRDAVTISGNMIAVRTEGITMLLNLPDAYQCFTQDYIASIRNYATMNDPEPLQNYMVEENVHYYLYDQYTQIESHIDSLEQDRASLIIGNMNSLKEDELKDFGVSFGEANGIDFDGTFKTNTAVWIRYTGAANVYVTIVGGKYLVYYFGETFKEDAEEILSNLDVFG